MRTRLVSRARYERATRLRRLAFFAWRRSLFGTIVCGTGVMLALRFGLGW